MPSTASSEIVRRLAPYLWTHQFTHLSPDTCFVLDDGQGRAVGYCIGCADTDTFVASYDSYVTNVLDKASDISLPAGTSMDKKVPWFIDGQWHEPGLAQSAYSGYWLLQAGNEDLEKEGYRATLHIDLLDEWQGKGWGRKLIDAFVVSAKAELAKAKPAKENKGIWLGVAGDNGKVVPFYQRMGFRLKERNAEGKTIFMVRDL